MTTTNDKVIDDTFVVHKTLGQGFTSHVVLAEHRDTGYKLAVKIFKPMRDMRLMVETFRKEVDSMKNLKHPNLINIIAANENGIFLNGKKKENIMYLGIELAEHSELFDYISDAGYGFSEKMARSLFKQILGGLKAMHDVSVAHRDLKTENIFLDGAFKPKVGDFGFAKFMDPNHHNGKLKTQLGTSGYQCPELIEKQYYSGESNDIFACGVILFILVNAYPPFREAKKTDNWYRHFYYNKIDNFWAIHSKKINISQELKDLLSGMLRYKDRWSMEDILKSDWIKGDLPSEDEYLEDMKTRNVKVEARRESERIERLEVQEGNGGSGVYRGEGEESTIENLFDELNKNDVENFPKLKWEGDLPRNCLKFNSTDIMGVYKNLISLIVNDGGKVELDTENYVLNAEYPYTSDILPEEENSNNMDEEIPLIGFNASLFIDDNTQSVIVNVIKDNMTDYFEFKDLINFLSKKYK
jgi:serine/threonine protein kinase